MAAHAAKIVNHIRGSSIVTSPSDSSACAFGPRMLSTNCRKNDGPCIRVRWCEGYGKRIQMMARMASSIACIPRAVPSRQYQRMGGDVGIARRPGVASQRIPCSQAAQRESRKSLPASTVNACTHAHSVSVLLPVPDSRRFILDLGFLLTPPIVMISGPVRRPSLPTTAWAADAQSRASLGVLIVAG